MTAVTPPPPAAAVGGRGSNPPGRAALCCLGAYAEIESDSTLENVLRVKEDGYLDGASFTARNPLGLVAHQEHLPRINYLARKAFGLPGDAIVNIAASSPENYAGGLPESVLLPVTRIVFLGARDHSSLRGRHRMLVAWSHWLRALP